MRPPGPSALRLEDIQGNILRPYRHHVASHVFVRFSEAAAARAWVGRLVPRVTRATPWGSGAKPATLNLAFTAGGLRALGVPARSLVAFPEEFLAGMAQRAAVLGDSGGGAPPNWEQPHWTAGGVHAMVAIHAASTDEVQATFAEIDPAGTPGVSVLFRDDACRLAANKEHFGFTDGFGQPMLDVDGAGRQFPGQGTPDGHGGWRPVALGEFLLGHPDEEGQLPPAAEPRELTDNGTFLVYRKLEQDVFGFRAWSTAQAARLGWDAARVGASIVGRWPDGSPLELRPHGPDAHFGERRTANNNFTYGGDPVGLACPLGAHIRRANPRDGLGFHAGAIKHLLGFRPEQLVSRHRMIRRGITFGPPLPEGAEADDGQPRGLLFIAAMASVARQFEFVQSQWLGSGNIFHLGDDRDVLTGQHDATAKMTVQGSPPRFLSRIPTLVTLRGGDYFFLPGIGGLAWLARQ